MLIANSLVEGFFKSNLMGQAIVAIQVLGSIVMIAVIIGKWRELAFLTSITRRFLRDFSTFGDVLGYYVKRRPAITDGIETIYKETCERLIRMITPELRVVGPVVFRIVPWFLFRQTNLHIRLTKVNSYFAVPPRRLRPGVAASPLAGRRVHGAGSSAPSADSA